MSENICLEETRKKQNFYDQQKIDFQKMISIMRGQKVALKIPMTVYRIDGPYSVFFKGVFNSLGSILLFSGKNNVIFPKHVAIFAKMEEIFTKPFENCFFTIDESINTFTNLLEVQLQFIKK